MFSNGSMLSDGSLMEWGCMARLDTWFPRLLRFHPPIIITSILLHLLQTEVTSCGTAAGVGGERGREGRLVPARMVLLCASSSPYNACRPFPQWGRTQLVPCRLERLKTYNFDLRYRMKGLVFHLIDGSFWRSKWRLASGNVSIFFGTFMFSQRGPER